jgi:hypothetical protein
MGVRKIFVVLVTIVACVIIGALVLNVLLPNVTTGIINAAEDMIFNATGMSFDFNGDSDGGEATDGSYDASITDGGDAESITGGVTGFN